MTEQSDAEVALDWARDMGDPNFNLNIPEEDKRQFRALASALEAADQRACTALCRDVEQERDQLAAVVEKVRAARANHPECELYDGDDAVSCGWKSAVIDIDTALASAPADALRERDAEKWDEGWSAAGAWQIAAPGTPYPWNPYRKEQP